MRQNYSRATLTGLLLGLLFVVVFAVGCDRPGIHTHEECISPSARYSQEDTWVRVFNPKGDGTYVCVPRGTSVPW